MTHSLSYMESPTSHCLADFKSRLYLSLSGELYGTVGTKVLSPEHLSVPSSQSVYKFYSYCWLQRILSVSELGAADPSISYSLRAHLIHGPLLFHLIGKLSSVGMTSNLSESFPKI